MTTQSSKQRQNWEKAEEVTKCLKDAIAGVNVESLIKQHKTILSEINTEFNITVDSCSQCCLDTLMPFHTKANGGCPLQQRDCNCLNEQGKKLCPSKFCSAMYDKITKQHKFQSPNWSTTDIKQWYTNYWEVAKCFIPKDKRIDKLKGQDRECIELLYVSINNVAVLSSSEDKVLELLMQIKDAQIRILNSPTKELDESTMKQYISDVTNLLRTDWLRKRKEGGESLNKILKIARMEKEEENIDQPHFFKAKIPRKASEQKSERKQTKTEQNQDIENAGTGKNGEDIDQSSDMKDKMLELSKRVDDIDNKQNKQNKEMGIMKEQLSECKSSVQVLETNLKNNEKAQNENLCMKEGETEQFSKEEIADTATMKSDSEETHVISRPVDGRLITLNNKQIDALMRNRDSKVLQGGFGSVFVSKSKVPNLDVRVVIKKIVCIGNERIKKLSTLNEKIAARVMHFAIVPLIAYAERQIEFDKREYYFLSPYLENKSLRELIARDKNCSNIHDVMLRCPNRVQILFQIASALDYLHTPVPGYRGIVLHMDVTTMNIVLDKHLNARLIDFGLAREMNEGQEEVSFTQSRLIGTPGYYPTARYSSLTVHEDYYNVGVVIRELLTGDAPYIEDGDEVSELRKADKDFIKEQIQKLIWPDGNVFALGILQLSERCLKSRDETDFTSAFIVQELKKILIESNHQWRRAEADKCDLCMVNLAVKDGNAPSHRCKMKICVSCMRNSHINPIRCPTCNEEVIPEIGHTFATLLIAGNDLENPAFAESFTREINEIKDVVASKYPCVIGISDENIKTITPSNPGKDEKLLPQVSHAFEELNGRENIGTLLIYFTGHHDSKRGFVLGCPDDVLSMAKLQEFLMNLCRFWENKARILVFLDCCEPPFMNIDAELSEAGVKIIQINACRNKKMCAQPSNGSLFQKFFVQALTRKIFNKQCYREKALSMKENECGECQMSGDFITGEKLLKYISDHMKKFMSDNEPVLNMHDVSWRDATIGYNVDFAVDLIFKFEMQSKEAIYVKLDPEMYIHCNRDINELKKNILQKVMCQEDVKLKVTDKFADVISLRIYTGSENGKELSTMPQLFAARNAKREIIASYRSVSHIGCGRVAMFTPTDSINQYFKKEKTLLKRTEEGREEANLSYSDFKNVLNDIRGKKDLETFRKSLIKVLDAWTNETNKEGKELKVTFPCIETENGNKFVVLDLSEKVKAASSALTNERTQS